MEITPTIIREALETDSLQTFERGGITLGQYEYLRDLVAEDRLPQAQAAYRNMLLPPSLRKDEYSSFLWDMVRSTREDLEELKQYFRARRNLT